MLFQISDAKHQLAVLTNNAMTAKHKLRSKSACEIRSMPPWTQWSEFDACRRRICVNVKIGAFSRG
jgi:hypothetical protein